MNTVPDQLTPLLVTDALAFIRVGLRNILGREVPSAMVAVLGAQAALETGRWQKIHCQNWGNIKAGDDYQGDVCFFRCNEVLDGKVEWFDPPHPQTRFRAYPDAQTGCDAWLAFVSGMKRYAGAWTAAMAGDPVSYVHALKLGGYFTADETAYRAGVMSLFREFLAKLTLQPPKSDPPPLDHDAAMAAVAASRWLADHEPDFSHSGRDVEESNGPE